MVQLGNDQLKVQLDGTPLAGLRQQGLSYLYSRPIPSQVDGASNLNSFLLSSVLLRLTNTNVPY